VLGETVRIARLFTIAGRSPYDGVAFRLATPLDSPEAAGFEVPSSWSEASCEALAELCFGAACVPTAHDPIVEPDVPEFLWRHRPAAAARYEREGDARQVFDRIAGAWAYQGWRGGYFDSEDDARAFYDEIRFLLCHRMLAPEAAQWGRTGMYWAYGLENDAEGWIVDGRLGELRRAQSCDERPHGVAILAAPRAAQRNPLTPWRDEATARVYGLETALNASALDASALKLGDALAQASPATGRTIVLNATHAEAASFVGASARAMQRAAALATGSHIAARHLDALAAACRARGRKAFDPSQNPALRLALIAAREAGLPDTLVERALRLTRQGRNLAEYPALAFEPDAEDEAVSPGCHTLRIAGERLEDPAGLNGIALAAWMGPGAGVFFAATAQSWNPCAADGEIGALAADGGYAFLDASGATRATLNLTAFLDGDGTFAVVRFAHAVRLAVLALDTTVSTTACPCESLAEGAWRYRPIGLGLCALGPLLLASGVAYDSPQGRALAAAVAALMGGTAAAASAELAEELGAYPRFTDNREHVLRTLRNHHRAAEGLRDGYEDLPHPPMPFDAESCPDVALARAARASWARALALGTAHGFRNAHTTMITPLPGAERILGCDAFGIEPDAALVKYERLPGGGFRKCANRHAAAGLAKLGYTPEKIGAMIAHLAGHGTLNGAPGIDHRALRARGFTLAALQSLEDAASSALDLRYAFNAWTLGEEFCTKVLGFAQHDLDDYAFDMPKALGFSEAEVEAANIWCCGAQTLEGARDLDPAHLPVFDTPRPQGCGKRALAWSASLRMMAAVQPFLSGGVGRRLVMPAEATVEDCARALWSAWGLGLKGLVIERESDPIPLADSPARAVEGMGSTPVHGSGGLRDRLVVIDGGDRPVTTPTTAPQTNAPQPTAFAGAPPIAAGSQALAIAVTAREFALRLAEDHQHHIETCRPDAGAVGTPFEASLQTGTRSRCPTCGNFAPEGARCGVCGSVHGGR
jgi:ribonucleoside-diphosphate reductase alpha chain